MGFITALFIHIEILGSFPVWGKVLLGFSIGNFVPVDANRPTPFCMGLKT